MEWDERKSKRILAGEPSNGPAFDGCRPRGAPIDRPGPFSMGERAVHPGPSCCHVNVDAGLRSDCRDQIPFVGPTDPFSPRERPETAEAPPAGAPHSGNVPAAGDETKSDGDHGRGP